MDNSSKDNTTSNYTSGLLSQLRDIGDQIKAGDIGKEKAWGGAGIIISDKAPEDDNADSWRSTPKYVVTPFVAELSWLFYKLRDTFGDYVDYVSKYEFYGRLSKAADGYSASSDTNVTLQGLLMATLDDAIVMASEMQSYKFQTHNARDDNEVMNETNIDSVGTPAAEGLMSSMYSYLCPRCNADYANEEYSGLTWINAGVIIDTKIAYNEYGRLNNIGYLHCSECGASSPLYACKEHAEDDWCVQEQN